MCSGQAQHSVSSFKTVSIPDHVEDWQVQHAKEQHALTLIQLKPQA